MQKSCAACGKSYEAQRSTSRYCGQACQKRDRRTNPTPLRRVHAERDATPAQSDPFADDTAEPQGMVERRVRAELQAAGWSPSLHTAAGSLGAMALDLARTQDQMPPGANKAPMNRELRLTLQDFRAVIEPAKGDAVDEAADEQPRRDAGAAHPPAAGHGNVRPFGRGRTQAG